jgi:hypothetical protein
MRCAALAVPAGHFGQLFVSNHFLVWTSAKGEKGEKGEQLKPCLK